MKKAQFFTKSENNKIICNLCPHNCIISTNQRGNCGVRKNINGELFTEVYGKISAINFDPIEKKPLYHFHPGKKILSIGTIGCNLHCKFCQNYDISQTNIDEFPYLQKYTSDELIKIALKESNNIGIAYTYNEPTIWYEFVIDTAKKVKANSLQNVMVTNGYINKEPLEKLMPYIDAFSVDLKAFTENFYKEITLSKLKPIKETLKTIYKNHKHLEITNLIIPGLNDDEKIFKEMVLWIAKELGKNTVLHLSRYFPSYKLNINSTPISKLTNFYNLAKKNLSNVYLGNVHSYEMNNTYCSECNKVVIKRAGYNTEIVGIDNNGNCLFCSNKILNP